MLELRSNLNKDIVIKAHHAVKHFDHFSAGRLIAVNDVTLQLERGIVHGLLGENGAGKTTLIKLINGYHRLNEGEIWYFNERTNFHSAREAISRGIYTIYQDFSLIENFTVEENLKLALSYSKSVGDISEIVSRYGKDLNIRSKISDLSMGLRQRVEIIKALGSNAKVLLLDEPTSVLTDDEKVVLYQDLRRIRDEGVAILITTHKLQDAVQFCDKITMMRRGRVVLETETKGTSLGELADAMVGGKFGGDLLSRKQLNEQRENVLEVEGLMVANDYGKVTVKDVSFTARRGEILGIIGVAGNGQVELAEALVGLRKPRHGNIRICGISPYDKTFNKRVKVGFITDDPLKMGLASNMQVMENFACGILNNFAERNILNKDKMQKFAEKGINEFRIVAAVDVPLRYLSGGNVQKVIVAREILKNCAVVIAVHPTKGLDINTTSLVWRRLCELAEGGCSVILVAEDIDEVFALSDRIGVIFEGKILKIDWKEKLDRGIIGRMMGGVDAGDFEITQNYVKTER